MKKWLRRIRGVFGTALTWAAAWAPAGALLGLIAGVLGGDPGVEVGVVAAGTGMLAILGFVGGASFAVVLQIAEGRRRFDEMSLGRFAAWGALGGLIMSAYMIFDGMPLTLTNVVGVGVVTLLCAGSAAGSLALARREDDQELLEAGEDVADVGLTPDEAQELLGKA